MNKLKNVRLVLNKALAKINDMENEGFQKYGSDYKSPNLDGIANDISKAKEILNKMN